MKKFLPYLLIGFVLPCSADIVKDRIVSNSTSRTVYPELADVTLSISKTKGDDNDIHELPLIDNLPEGMEKSLYSRDSFYFARDGQGMMYAITDYGMVSYIAISENEIYISNPFGGWPTGTWLKGERKDDKVTITFPQLIYRETYPDWENDPEGDLGLTITDNYYAYKFILVEGEDKSSFLVDSDNPEITFSFDGKTLKEEGDSYIGMVGEYRMYDENNEPYIGFNWMGFADGKLNFSEVDSKILEIPQNIEFEQWILDNQGSLTFVEVGFSDEDVFLRGFIETEYPDGSLGFPAIKGQLKDGKLKIYGIQYLGIDPRFSHFAYAMPATFSEGSVEWEGENIYSYCNEINLEYNGEKKIFNSKEGEAIVVSTIPDGIFTLMALDEPILRWQDMSTPLVPCEPTDIKYKYFDDYEFGVVGFSLSNISEDGRLMDTSRLYYSIYINGEEFTFYPDEYWDLEEPMTLVPYDYWDSSINSFGEEHEVLLYVVDIDSIGIQAIYKNIDDSETFSKMAVYGMSDGVTTSKESGIINTTWYDVSGRKLTSPVEGVMIMRSLREDGSVEVRKVIYLNGI